MQTTYVTTDDGRTIRVEGADEKDGQEIVFGTITATRDQLFKVGDETWSYASSIIREETR
jgi:hypothetical protein